MPSTVHDGYTSSLDRILALPPSRSAVALRTIGWIVRAERRLRISEVLHAFAYEANTNDIDDDNILSPKLVIQSCVGLVYLDKENSTLGLIHETAYQFLRGIPQLQNVETNIATTSIRYLSLPCLSSPCADLSTLLQRQASKPFLSYAAQFWGIHSRRVEGQILPQILSFLGNSHRIASSFQVLQSGEWKGPELAVAIFQSLPSGQEPLHIAAFWGLDATISSLLSAGADPHVQDRNGWAPLHWAASNGHSTSADILLNTSVDVNAADLRGWTPLFWAAFRGHQHIAATLLKKGANHRLRDNNGWACLHWAISTRQVEIVKMLLDHHRDFTTGLSQPQIPVETLNDARVGGTNLKLRAGLADTTIDDGYIAPLELAAETGDVGIFELLLKDLGPSPGAGSRDSVDELNEETLNEWPWQPDFKFDLPLENIWMALIKFRHARERPEENWMTSMLLKAIRGNKLHVAEMLLELGADPSLVAVYSPGLTALHVATFLQDTRFVDLILKFDPKTISLRDVGGRTALMQAVINGSPSIAKILLDHGSEVNIQDQAGNTPLICAARVKSPLNSLELVRELLRRGAEISVQNSRRETVLHHAVPEVIETLLAAGADPKVIDKGGKTVLDTFIEHRFFSIAEEKPEHNRVLLTLLELCEPSPKHQNAALQRGNWTAFRLLLAHGVEPTRDFVWRNQTLAKAVIRAGQLDILRYLLEKGAVLTSYLTYLSIVHKLFKPQHYQAQIMEVEKMEAAFEVLQTFYPEVLSREMMTSVLHYALIMTESEGHIRLLLKYGASIFDVDDLTPSMKEDGYERTRVDAFVHSVLHGRWEALSFFITLLETVPAPPCHWISQLNVNGTISSDDHIRQLLNEIHRAGKFNCLGEGEWTRNAPPKLSTPVQLATRRGDLRGLKFLFEATGCADVEAVDKWGWTLLHWAIYLGHHDIFNFLLECGADVSARTASWASTSAPVDNLDISEMAEALVLRGADSKSLV
ncbi:hypothetical protein D9611_009269 [Ephemerocybe angulata]|uniref:Uncharacterized protein n=1 Tax=Ephemerocybe angulata TaxID=980116 RepID=A0A8H5BH96_9AGAR|nr:hypothetical protein D9611_009269 [Tulosesus angulatus]